ncbi:hypothetical protein Noc_1080 [Nitrosococcus oceani ATCC 19707]|uniref:CDP-alcohol phosphatidyltransferase n=2 Tax=Nitrosococcus oceani TaxID=1229 RepID=Q3JC61_NITOC|nr:CDP-alcohol phosphatidyltransferase family protein [Nitrosococcus oceani]ABA57585.1 hypothetical protein Noc_1080 [Nitrosococcus oceani ATCC 19707]EDZ67954.1 hypothetical protein NOC27_1281 [Nitrosococcus oceani AFC27]KFI20088.1 hypothetical protein IB75_05560 [Nitrosococcus oceani C-27]GEM20622.1 hypothetical protein NONS58_20410 [Nitrosococcus oceani]
MAEGYHNHIFRQQYRRLLIFQSLISVLLLAASAFYLQKVPAGYAFVISVAVFWLLGSHGFLIYFLRAWRTPADWATLLRFFLAIAGLLIAIFGGALLWILVMTSLASLGDWLDGWLADRYGGTSQGAILDAETDQTLIFMLAVLGASVGGLALWVLLFPAYRYGYILLLEIFAIPADDPKPKAGDNFRGRIACATIQVALLANLLPSLALPVKTLFSALALGFLTYSFADDLFYQFKARFASFLRF